MKYIIRLIKLNPVKIFFLCLSIIFGISANNVDVKTIEKHNVISTFESNNITNYIVESNNIKGWYSFTTDDNIIKINDGFIIIERVNVLLVILLILFIVSFLVFLLSPLLDVYNHWDFVEVYNSCLIDKVKIDKEDDNLYYHFRGKLLTTQVIKDNKPTYSYRLSDSEILRYLIDFNKNPNLYDDYRGTKSQIRDKKIKDIIESNGNHEH